MIEAVEERKEMLKRKSSGRNKLKERLSQVESNNQLIHQLKEQGLVKNAVSLQMRHRWKAAFDRSEGRKVKDDANLLMKSLKREQKSKEKSRKEWKERKEALESQMAKRQLKRHKNLQKRKHKKKEKKIRIQKKKGRIF